MLSCGSDYSLIELALLFDPNSVLYRDQCYSPASGTCCAHLSVFNRVSRSIPSRQTSTGLRRTDASRPVRLQRLRSKSWRAFGRTSHCRRPACRAASTITPAKCEENTDHSRVATKDFGQRHSTFQPHVPFRPTGRPPARG